MNQEDAKQKRVEIKELFDDVIRRRKKPSRIPLMANDSLWKINDEGYDFSVALNDYDILFDVCCKFHERYDYDNYSGYCTRNLIRFVNSLGKNNYIVEDNPNNLYILDNFHMHDDEYPVLKEEGLVKYFFNYILERQFEFTSVDDAISKFKTARIELERYNSYYARISKHFREFYGIPDGSGNFYLVPFEQYTKCLRGIKNASIDLRRHKQEMLETTEVIDNNFWPAFERYGKTLIPGNDNYIFDASTVCMGWTILNTKQFGEFYWPYLKKMFDFCDEHDQTAQVYAEGSFMNKLDYFKDLQDKHYAIYLEQDDPVVIRKELPNMTVIGGFSTTLLGTGTVEECVEEAKRLVEEVDQDGYWIFSQDKMLSFPKDAKRENMLEVNRYLRSVKL